MTARFARTFLAGAGFTLIELLTVIAILALLAAIASRTLNGAKERSRILQCRAELACLAQALADYKREHGNFPFAAATAEASAACLFAAVTDGRRFDVSRLPSAALDSEHIVFVDPWGNPYVYSYQAAPNTGWKPDGFILFSAGPDGVVIGPDETGRFLGGRHAAPGNADNIYSDKVP